MRWFAQETLAISEKTHVKILQKLAKGTWEILGEVIQSNISISINIGITVYAAPMMIATSVEWFRKSVQVPKSYVWAQSSFFCQTEKIVEPRAFLIGVSNAATIRLSSLEFSRRQ